MATKVEMQYKLLNAELMEQVQKQRLEIGEYRKRVITLERENMDLREEHILEKNRQRLDNIGAVRSLMQRLNVNSDCLESGGSQEPTPVVCRPNAPRRSSREICRDIRRTCALARTTRTISPRRSTTSVASTTSSTSRRSSAETISEEEATMVAEKRRPMKHTPPPRRPGELLFDEDDSEEESITVASPVHRQEENNNEEEEQTDQNHEAQTNQENKLLFSIIEENDSETETTADESSSCEAIYCDTTIDSSPTNGPATATPCGRALREVDTNVPEAVSLNRGKETGKPKNSSIRQAEENSLQEPSIQCARLAVTRPSHSSGIFPDINGSTPRRSLFNGIGQVAGSTSTPITNGHKSAVEKERKKSEKTEMSSSFFSSSGRPSRSCRPTSLVERNLKDKMRNEAKGKAKK
ncbi:hypothetical protein KR084_003884 [Drosophila pseudotakahashii]|nr:hypothetical protein KR084_003884 [Drosophila pseudotakahashii]